MIYWNKKRYGISIVIKIISKYHHIYGNDEINDNDCYKVNGILYGTYEYFLFINDFWKKNGGNKKLKSVRYKAICGIDTIFYKEEEEEKWTMNKNRYEGERNDQ
uniref:Uncharacterized protein n=1 Tax=Onchocerca volvulus TaxID=6282 RepID=A0A8R1TND0_ONCVO